MPEGHNRRALPLLPTLRGWPARGRLYEQLEAVVPGGDTWLQEAHPQLSRAWLEIPEALTPSIDEGLDELFAGPQSWASEDSRKNDGPGPRIPFAIDSLCAVTVFFGKAQSSRAVLAVDLRSGRAGVGLSTRTQLA